MNIKTYQRVRAAVAFFVAATVSVAVTQNSNILAVAGVLTGMLFLLLVRTKVKIVVDERETSIREKAAQMTYAIFAPTIGLGSFLLNILGSKSPYLFALGQVMAYLTLFLIAIYALSYHFLSRQYGGGTREE